jgi:hypothetical protein
MPPEWYTPKGYPVNVRITTRLGSLHWEPVSGKFDGRRAEGGVVSGRSRADNGFHDSMRLADFNTRTRWNALVGKRRQIANEVGSIGGA